MNDRAFKRTPVAQAISLILGTAVVRAGAFAQAATLEEIIVTGIRGSLTSSMNLKRDAQGVVDGIVAEDIGKFPDTNLAESLQRISGVSIDRSIGEGSRVTVRGVGPDFNLVLLNGRQMPGVQHRGHDRFEFARLRFRQPRFRGDLRDRGLQDQPRQHADRRHRRDDQHQDGTPARQSGPALQLRRQRRDRHVGRQPARAHLQGDSITPEISGIYSNTFADDKFGVAISASYQERDLGFNQAAVPNGWRPFARRREQLGHDSAARRARLGEHHQPPRCDRHLFGAAEPRLQRQRRRAQAHQRPAGAAVGAGGLDDRDARLHLLREQGRARSATSCRCGSTSVRPPALDRRSGRGAERFTPRRYPCAANSRPVDGRREVRHQEREQVGRLQPRLGRHGSLRPGARLPRLQSPNPGPTARTARTRCWASPASIRGTRRRTSRRTSRS